MNSSQSKAAQEAEAFLESLNKGSGNINASLQKQIAELESINKSARSDLEEVEKQLEKDGLKEAKLNTSVTEKKPVVSGSETEKIDINAVFGRIGEAIKDEVIGQDDFVRKLLLSFKRPFVMGKEEGKPASTIIITGKNGTGRHSALANVTQELAKEKVLPNGDISIIDLGIYGTSGESRLFIQDMFAALESKAAVILFENYDKCHKSLLTMLANLTLEGAIRLSARYVLQKGILVDAGTALVPNAISTLNCNGQYLVFMTNNNQGKIADTMGAAFINGIGDICMTSDFAADSLTMIGNKELRELKEKASKMLEFELNPSDDIGAYFAGKFTLSDGVNSITDYSDLCFKTLSEYKLNETAGKMSFDMYSENDLIKFKSGDTVLLVENAQNFATAVDDVKLQMQEVIGLESVKEYIFSLEENYKVQQLRKKKGMKADSPSMHMIFTGNPGTGKTTIARLVSRYLKAIGVLSGGQLIEVTRADLVGRFVGHTAPLTRQVIESAIGGVLFIDEAYSLYRGNDDSFGLEAIDTLVKGMEDNRENLLVILAGYSREMQEFLTANSGLQSRFPNIIEFPDYSAEELLSIAKITVKNKGYSLSADCDKPLLDYFGVKQSENPKINGNGRMARNLIENAILNQSKRIIAEKSENLEELILMDFDLE